jgi:integrase
VAKCSALKGALAMINKLYRKTIRQHGKIIDKTFGRKEDADRWYWEMRRQKDLAKNGLEISITEKTVQDFAEEWLQNRKIDGKPSSSLRVEIQRFEDYVTPIFGHRPMHRILQREWEDFLSSLISEHELSNATRNRVRSMLHKFYRDARRRGLVTGNPITDIPRLKEGMDSFDYFETVEECGRYLYAAEQEFRASWIFSVAALNTGARLGEILALRWKDMDLRNRRLHIHRTMDNASGVIEERTKSTNDRWLGINDSLFEALMRLRGLTKRLNPNDLIVSDDDGESYRTRIRSAHDRSCKRAGLRIIRPHDLRHTYASHFVMSGGTLEDLRALLGHASIKMVLRYAHLAPGYLEKKANTVCLRSQKSADIISLDQVKKQLG